MKTVFDTREIAHLWAQQNLDQGRNAASNLFFVGDTIYSYGRHFPMARFVTPDCVFITTRRYSVTTSKHLSFVRQSLSDRTKRFYVHDVNQPPKDQLRYFAEQIADCQKQLGQAKRKNQVAKLWGELNSLVETANEFSTYFKLRKQFKLSADWEQEQAEAIKIAKREAIKQAKEQAKREAAAKQRRIEYLAEMQDDICQWRKCEIDYLADYNMLPTMLRLNGEEVQTSHGANFPIDHARRALKFVQHVIDSGEEFQANGKQVHLGHYHIDSIDKQGTIHAGCHHVAKEEVQAIIAQLQSLAVLESIGG